MKNSFIENLENQVNENNARFVETNTEEVSGISKKEYVERELKKIMEQRENLSPITDPKAEKKFKKEMKKSLEEAYDSLKKEQTEKETSKEEKKAEENIQKQNESGLRNIEDKDIGYLDRLALLHQMKQKMLKEQRDRQDFVPSTKEAYKIMLLEASIEKDREKYISAMDEKEVSNVVKIEEKYRNEELDIVRAQNKEFREKIYEFEELNKKLKDINDWFEEMQSKMRDGKLDEEEYRREAAKKQDELDDILKDINKLNPEKLQKAVFERQRQDRLQKSVMGKDYNEKVFLRSSKEMQGRLNYLHEKNAYNAFAILEENKYLQKQGIERTIKEHEEHKEKLEKELEKLEDTPENLKRRSEIIKELRITDAKLDGYEATKENLEYGLQNDKDVQAKIDSENIGIEEDIKEVEKDFKDIDQVVEKSEKDDFDMNSSRAKTEEEIRKESLKTGMTVGVAVKVLDDCPYDTEHAVVAGVVASKIKENNLRQEWENAVSKEYNAKDVQEKQQRDKAIEEDLKEQEKVYERERTRRD